MNKGIRQYFGLFSAIITYYFIHEGAHLLYAVFTGAFKRINFMGLGVQVDVYIEKMTQMQLGVFCLLGSIATAMTSYILICFISQIGKSKSKIFKACMYYITIGLLILDPLYLSILCNFVGGGDMNGISFLIPERIARMIYGVLVVIHGVIIFKVVIPKYKLMFEDEE